MIKHPDNLILFDPHCNLCSAVVKYLLKHDKAGRFHYGSLYSVSGKKIKKHVSWQDQKNTILYFEKQRVYTQSDAAIRIVSKLPGLHRSVIVFKIIPKSVRDSLYKLVAKYRYKWFGKTKHPFYPERLYANRFIDYFETERNASKPN